MSKHGFVFELPRQLLMSEIIFGDRKQPARVLIKAMHDAGPMFAETHGQLTDLRDQGIHQSVLCMSGRGMNDKPGGLVHH